MWKPPRAGADYTLTPRPRRSWRKSALRYGTTRGPGGPLADVRQPGKVGGRARNRQHLVRLAPESPEGWIYKGSALVELKRLSEAHQTLSLAAAKFPSDEIILYDLACVCCAMDRVDESKSWLGKAIDASGNPIKLWALDDPDLEALWVSLRQL